MVHFIRNPLSKNTTKSSSYRGSERGNVFFTLFGAVAVVGVLGAGIMQTMRGPLSTMVEVNLRERAKIEMSIASKLVLLESTNQDDSGDCDSDGFIEPISYNSSIAGTGGGTLPVGSRTDPWGTDYVYCAWDAGPSTGTCGAPYDTLLDGNGEDTVDGPTATNYAVIAIISAGPDGNYSSSCADHAGGLVTPGGDDIVEEYTYEYAMASTDGLWKIKQGTPTSAEIQKDVDLTSETDVFGTTRSPKLILGGSSLVLPTDATPGMATCNDANVNILRVNTGATPHTVEICLQTSPLPPPFGTHDWSTVSAGGTASGLEVDDTTVVLNDGTPSMVFTLDGTTALTMTDVLFDLTSLNFTTTGTGNFGSTLDVGDLATLESLEVTNDATFNGVVNMDGDVTITGTANAGAGNSFVVNNSDSSSVFTIGHDGHIDTTGDINLQGDLDSLGDVSADGFINTDVDYRIDDTTVLTTEIANVPGTIVLGAGAGAALDTTTGGGVGDNNTVLGANAGGTNLTTGTGNILIGQGVDVSGAGASNELNIGGAITGDLTNGDISVTRDITAGRNVDVSSGAIISSDNTAGNILVADGTDMDSVAASGDINIAGDGEFTITDDAVQDDDIDASSFSAGAVMNAPCLKTDGSTVYTEDCSASGGGDGVGSDGLTEVLANSGDGGAGDIFNIDNIYNVGNMNDIDMIAVGSTSFSTGDQTLEVDITGDIGAVNYCDEDGNDCFQSSDVVSSINNRDIIYDTDLNTYIDVDTTDDGLTNVSVFVNNGLETMRISPVGVDAVVAMTATSDDQGFLPPRVTDPATNIGATDAGLMAYDSTDNQLQFFDGTAWVSVVTGTGSSLAIDDLTDAIHADSSLFLGGGSGVNDDTSSNGNVGVGFNALSSVVSGSGNVAVGLQALEDNTGTRNVALGNWAMRENTSGNNNNAIGNQSLFNNTTGEQNIAIGDHALHNNTTGRGNVAIGYEAAGFVFGTQGDMDYNTALGYRAGLNLEGGASEGTGANNNLLLGFQAGDLITTGDNNVIIGYDVDPSSATASNELNIGGVLFSDLSTNRIGIGVADATAIDTDAVLELDGTNVGFLPPRNADPATNIGATSAGLVAYDSTDNVLQFFDGTQWLTLVAGASGVADRIQDLDNNTYIDVDVTDDGTTDSIVFATAGTQRMSIDDQGYVTLPGNTTYIEGADAAGSMALAINNTALSATSQSTLNFTGGAVTGASSVGAQITQGWEIAASDDDSYLAFSTRLTDTVSEAMRINSAGQVGIGTTTPDANAILDLTSSTLGFLMPRNADPGTNITGTNGLLAYDSTDNEVQYFDGISWVALVTTDTAVPDDSLDWAQFVDTMTLDATTTIDMDTNTSDLNFDANTFVIDSSTNRIGIGTAAPTGSLHVVTAAPGLGTNFAALTTDTAGIHISEGPNDLYMDSNTIANSGSNFLFGTTGAYDLAFYSNAAERMRIASAGNVGIGTNSPDANAILDLTSSTQGFLPPRNADPDSNITGTAGLVAYDSTDNVLQFFDGTQWLTLVAGASGVADRIQDLDNNTYIDVDTSDDGLTDTVALATGGTQRILVEADGDVAVDTDTLFVDATNNRVGIGTASPNPNTSLDIRGNNGNGQHLLEIHNSGGGGDYLAMISGDANPSLEFGQLNNGAGTFYVYDADGNAVISTIGNFSSLGPALSIGEQFPDGSAALEIETTNRGFLPPRITDPSGDIASPATGLIAYDSTDNQLQFFDGTSWLTISASAGSGVPDRIEDTGDANTYIDVDTDNADGNNTISFNTAGAEAMLIESNRRISMTHTNGNVTTPTGLTLLNTSAAVGSGAGILFQSDTNVMTGRIGGYYVDTNNGGLTFDVFSGGADTEAMRIDSDGDVGIGTASPDYDLHVSGFMMAQNNVSAGVTPVYRAHNIASTANSGAALLFEHGAGATNSAQIGSLVNAANDADLTFTTLNSGGYAERMRIDSSTGGLVIGATAGDANAILQADSATQGFLPPRNTDPDGNITGTAGLIAYDSTDNELQYFDGTNWVTIVSSGASVIAIDDLTDALNDPGTNDNLALGHEFPALDGATPGARNVSVGTTALDAVTTGDDNIAIGYDAATAITTQNNVVAIGTGAGSNIGSGSIAIGQGSGSSVTGIDNTLIGRRSGDLASTTTESVIIGSDAGRFLSGNNNVAIGNDAAVGDGTTTANNSVFVGHSSGLAITTGNNNLFLGYQAGDATTSGSDNIIIGYDIDASSATASNELNIGGVLFSDLSTNRVGIGVADAASIDANAALEVTGSNLGFLPPRNTDPNTNITGTAGLIAYDSTDDELQFFDGTSWEIIATTNTAVPDDSIDWDQIVDTMTLDATTTIDMDTNGGDLNFDAGTFVIDSSANAVGIGTTSPNASLDVTGDFLVTGTHTGTASVPVSGAGTRMFFDSEMSAFRVGNVIGTEWDNGSIGQYSTAIGHRTTASGFYSTALGNTTTASGGSSMAMGQSTIASGLNSTAMGLGTTASGSYSTAMGESTVASGSRSITMGRSVVAGDGTAASGFGDGSMAIGLIDDAVTISTPSQVTGIQSLGIFMGDQDGLVMSADNTMGLFGGSMVIDDAVPATTLAADANAILDLNSTDKGFLPPRNADPDGNITGTAGLIAYDSTDNQLQYFDGTDWVTVSASVGSGIQDRIQDTGDANTYIDVDTDDADGNNTISFNTAGSERALIEADGDVAIDTDTLFVDAANDRVGIGTTTPVGSLQISNALGTGPNIGIASIIQPNVSGGGNAVGISNGVNALSPDGTGEYKAIDSNIVVNTAGATVPEVFGYRGYVLNNGTGTVTDAYGIQTWVANGLTGSIDNSYGMYVSSDTNGAGSIDNSYGLYIEDMTGSTTENYALYTNAGEVRFGDDVVIGAANPDANAALDVNGTNKGFLPPRNTDPGTNITGTAGLIAYDSTDNQLQFFDGTDWVTISAGVGTGVPDRIQDTDNNTYIDVDTTDDGATNTISFTTAGVERMLISNSGRTEITSTLAGLNPVLILTNPSTADASGNQILFKSGSTNNGEINTQIDGTTADSYMTFSTRGSNTLSERMRITSTGAVGIGTGGAPDANAALEVTGTNLGFLPPRNTDPGTNITGTAGLIAYDSTDDELQFFDGTSWVVLATTASAVPEDSIDWDDITDTMTLDATTTIDMDTNTSDLNFDANTFVIDSSTNRIGLGTTTPAARLHVNGTPGTPADGITFGDGDSGIYESLDDTIGIQINGSGGPRWFFEEFRFGSATATGPTMRTGAAGTPQFVPNGSSTGAGLGTPTAAAADTLAIFTAGNEVMFFDAAGRIGIGTSSPNANAALDVNGTNLGFLPPRNADPDGNITGTAGLIAYDSTDDELQFFDGTNWVSVATTAGVGALAIDDLTDAATSATGLILGDGAASALSTNTQNVVVGINAMVNNTTGSNNVFVGYGSGGNAPETDGALSNNTVIGSSAGAAISSGATGNLVIGFNAGQNIRANDNNITIGNNTGVSSFTASNEMNIGDVIFGDLSTNRIGIGVSDATAIDANAALEVTGTNLGFLPPRNTDPNTNITGTAGLIAYDSTDDELQFFDGTSWVVIATTASAVPEDSIDWDDITDTMTLDATTTIDMDTNTADLNFDANTFVIDSSANSVGIGTNTPDALLNVEGATASELLELQQNQLDGGFIQFRNSNDNIVGSISEDGEADGRFDFRSDDNFGRIEGRFTDEPIFEIVNTDPTVGDNDARLILDSTSQGEGEIEFQYNDTTNWTIQSDDSASGPLRFENAGGTAVVTLLNGGAVGVGTETPDANAALEVTGTDLGFLPPRNTDPDGNITGTAGLIAYDSTDNELQFFDGTDWVTVAASTGGGLQDRIQDADNNTYIDVDTTDDGLSDRISMVVGGSERVFIDSDGDLQTQGNRTFVEGTNSTGSTGLSIVNTSLTASSSATLTFRGGASQTSSAVGATIRQGWGVAGVNDDSYLTFITQDGGASGERLRITEDGDIATFGNYINNDGDNNEGLFFDTAGRGTFGSNNGGATGLSIWNVNPTLSSSAEIEFKGGAGAATTGRVGTYLEALNYGTMYFTTTDAGGNNSEKMRITSDGQVVIGTTTADANAILQADSTTQGFLPPRNTDPNTNITGTAGLIAYDSTDDELQFFDGTSWVTIATTASAVPADSIDWDDITDTMTLDATTTIDMDTNTADLNFDANTFVIDSSADSVGIGTNAPDTDSTLDVRGNAHFFLDGTYGDATSAEYVEITNTGSSHPHVLLKNGGGSSRFGRMQMVGDDLLLYTGGAGTTNQLVIDGSTDQIGINTATPDANAALDITSSDKGFLPPRNTDPNTNITGTAGLIAYDSTDNELQFYNGSAWVAIANSGASIIGIDDLTDGASDGSSVFLGSGAGANDDGTTNDNTGVGIDALADNTSGGSNTAIGSSAQGQNISGDQNTAVGLAASYWNTTGSWNTSMGSNALLNSTGDNNTAVGYRALLSNTGGNGNTALGSLAAGNGLAVNGSMTNNTLLGYRAGYEFLGGADNNILVGYQAGDLITTGDNNIIIGYDVDPSSATVSNELNIGGVLFGDLSTSRIGIGVSDATAIDANAALEVTGTDLGFLPPRNTDPNTNITGTAGLIAYDSTDDELQFFDGTSWVTIATTASAVPADSIDWDDITDTMTLDATTTIDMDTNTADLNFDANTFVIDSSADSVGIGIPAPSEALDVDGSIRSERLSGSTTGNFIAVNTGSGVGSGSGYNFRSGSVLTAQVGTSYNSTTDADLTFTTRGADGFNERMRFDSSTGGLVIGATTGDANAALDVNGTNLGFLPPRNTDPNTNITGTAGLIAYDSTDDELQFFDGTSWVTIATTASAVPADSIDWDDITDTMTLDATTTIDMDTNGANFNFDSNTFVIDSVNNRIGVGVAAPDVAIDVAGEVKSRENSFRVVDGDDDTLVWMGNVFGHGGISIHDNLGTRYANIVANNNTHPKHISVGNFGINTGEIVARESLEVDWGSNGGHLFHVSAAAINHFFNAYYDDTTDTRDEFASDGSYAGALAFDPTTGALTLKNSTATGLEDAAVTWNTGMTLSQAGTIGIGTTSPDANAALEVTGTDLGFLPPRNADPATNITGTAGLIAYDSTDDELQFFDGTSWVAVVTSGGTGSSLWTDNTTHITRENFHILDAGLANGSTTAGLDGDGTYAFYDPDKGALRGGTISSSDDAWQDTNVGTDSFAWGNRTQASGDRSVAMGERTTASGNMSVAFGQESIASGGTSFAFGDTVVASNDEAFAVGLDVTASGNQSIAMGNAVTASGNSSMALGLGSIQTGAITVSADEALGIFLDDMGGATDLSTQNVMAIMGGSVGIGTTSPDASALLDVSSTAAGLLPPRMTTAQRDAINSGTFASGLVIFNTTTSNMEFYDGSGWVSMDSTTGGAVSAINDLTDGASDATSVFLGSNAGTNDDGTANENTATGINAMASTDTGAYNAAFGYDALTDNTSGGSNTAIGSYAQGQNISGDHNTAVGADASYWNTTGSWNTSMGSNALINSTGDLNTAFGYRTLLSNTGGSGNTAFGSQAAGNNLATNGSMTNNTLLGYRAGYEFLGGADNNILIGYQAGDVITTGDNNIIIGYDVDPSSATATSELNIGDLIYGRLDTGRVGIGTNAPDSIFHVNQGANVSSMELNAAGQLQIYGDDGSGTLQLQGGGGSGVYSDVAMFNNDWSKAWSMGYNTTSDTLRFSHSDNANHMVFVPATNQTGFGTNTPDASAAIDITSTAAGFLPPRMTTAQRDAINSGTFASGLVIFNTTTSNMEFYDGSGWISMDSTTGGAVTEINDLTDGATDSTSVFLGSGSGANDDGTNDNTGVGIGALNANIDGVDNTAVGNLALNDNTSGNRNTAVGSSALPVNTSGNNNTALGTSALNANDTGTQNTATGYSAMRNNTSGDNNTATGFAALYHNTTGQRNTVFGTMAGGGNSGGGVSGDMDHNTIIGYQAGYAMEGGAAGAGANNNIMLGYQAGDTVTTGDDNIIIGYDVQPSAATASNELNIGSAIFGNLSTGQIGIGVSDATAINANAALEVTGTNLGFLPPRNTDPNTNITGTAGLIAYDSTDNELQFYNGSAWVALADTTSVSPAGADRQLQFNDAGSFGATNNANGQLTFGTDGRLTLQTLAGDARYVITDSDDDVLAELGDYGGHGFLALADSNGTNSTRLGPWEDNYIMGDNLFIERDNNYVGIGTNVPTSKLHVSEDDADTRLSITNRSSTAARYPHLMVENYDGTGQGGFPTIAGTLFRGDSSAPTAAQANDTLAVFAGLGATDTSYNTGVGGRMVVRATENYTGSANGGQLLFQTTANGATAPTTRVIIDQDGQIGIGTTSPDQALDVVGDIQFSGILVDASDRRLKENITPLDSDTIMERFAQLGTYTFTMKDDPDGQIEYGVIAQEVEEVFPELVVINDDEMKTRHVNYLGFVAPLIESTNTLRKENEKLQASLQEKEARLEAIEARMAAFETDMAGMKMHTGYGFLKASLIPGMVVLMLLFGGGCAFVARRHAFNKAAGE